MELARHPSSTVCLNVSLSGGLAHIAALQAPMLVLPVATQVLA
jgi:hypothetical protein